MTAENDIKGLMSNVHPELRQIARLTPRYTVGRRNLWLIHWLMSLMRAPKSPQDLQVENIFIPSRDGGTEIRLRTYKPKNAPVSSSALLWLHGGGYVLGKPEMDDARCSGYVRETGLVVVSVDYRLAPNHPFPAGLEDSYAALKWMVSHAQQLGIDAGRIAIGGASAGGGLAAALVQFAHDRREIEPAFQLLVYPMLDDRTVLRSDLDDSSNVAWSQKSNRFGWESYLGRECGTEVVSAYSVPARREDLSGLPPAWIGVGSVDLFYDEDAAYSRRLQECGSKCELYLAAGAFHGFDVIAPGAPIAQEFRKSQYEALKKNLCFTR